MQKPNISINVDRKTISLDKYAEEWIAFADGKVVAHHKGALKRLMEKLKRLKRVKKPSVLLVPKKKEETLEIVVDFRVGRGESQSVTSLGLYLWHWSDEDRYYLFGSYEGRTLYEGVVNESLDISINVMEMDKSKKEKLGGLSMLVSGASTTLCKLVPSV